MHAVFCTLCTLHSTVSLLVATRRETLIYAWVSLDVLCCIYSEYFSSTFYVCLYTPHQLSSFHYMLLTFTLLYYSFYFYFLFFSKVYCHYFRCIQKDVLFWNFPLRNESIYFFFNIGVYDMQFCSLIYKHSFFLLPCNTYVLRSLYQYFGNKKYIILQ